LLPCWLEEGFNRSQLINAVLKTLGYAKVKGEKDTYQKRLSGEESLKRVFGLAVENISFLLTALERNCLEDWRRAVSQPET